jgi:prevent-host-death family protein
MKLVPQPMIPAKDFQRHIRRYQRLALTQPLTITAHGEPSLVMMSLNEYQRLKGGIAKCILSIR